MKVQLSLRNSDLLWLGIVLFIILTIAFLLPIPPNDYWWYLRLGEDIVDTRVVPGVDIYSSTQFGQPITYQSWLSAVLFYFLNRIGGSLLTVLVRGIIIAAFYFLIWYTCRLAGGGARLASLVTLVAALASSNNWAIRPQLFSLVLFALFLSFLWQWRKGKTRWIWVLPILMLLWVNLHGAFILGFMLVIVGLICGEGKRRELFITLILMGVISFINPHGWGVWQYVFSLLSDPASQQLGTEWHPLNIRAWQGLIFYVWLLFFPILASYSKHSLAWMDWLLFLGFGWMALNGLRYVIWFVAILAVMSTSLLEPLVGNYLDMKKIPGKPAINGVIISLLLFLPVAFLPGIRDQWWEEYPPILMDNTPVDAVDWLKDHPELPGPLWSDLAFSSYVIYAIPERPVWIDPRFELYPISHWNKYIRVSTASPMWSTIMDEEAIAMVLVDVHEQDQLIYALDKDDNWCLHFHDNSSRIYTRISEAGDC
jgi:hypothetical protein